VADQNPTTEALVAALEDFVEYRLTYLDGDEKGEAQVFLDRLIRAFGNRGIAEVGAKLEKRIKKNDQGGTSFADLVWAPRVLIEMKKAGVDLATTYQQAFDYWVNLVPSRPSYVVLCNFDEFWIYDLNKQVHDPVDKLRIQDLPKRWEALAFLLPVIGRPIFEQDMAAVTAAAADKVAQIFKALVDRGIDKTSAQRFVLQSVLTMFAEDIGLLPRHFFTASVHDCVDNGASPYLTIFGLFDEMNSKGATAGGPYKGTPYFNGGLFASVKKFDLEMPELELLKEACTFDWSAVRPAIFGTIFEGSLAEEDRHRYGQHFTDEADIMRVVGPTITSPWLRRISAAKTLKDLGQLEQDLLDFRVLDPACGSGNFLYLAYRELRRVEAALRERRQQLSRSKRSKGQVAIEFVTPSHFFGIDVDPFAIEIAKMTLMLAKKLAADDVGDQREVLPLDDLTANFFCTDALDPSFHWPAFDACIGNPPYLGRMKVQAERGVEYLHDLDAWFPDVKGKADYVVYWFRRAHDSLPNGGRAGFVATDSIREGSSRAASLGYVLERGGTITEAVSSQEWTGTAQVRVSIVNWVKGEERGKKVLVAPDGSKVVTDSIGASLSDRVDTSSAVTLKCNSTPKRCFQGQTPGHASFVEDDPALAVRLAAGPGGSDVVRRFFTGKDLNSTGAPSRWVIDFPHETKVEAKQAAPGAFQRIELTVLPDRREKAREEEANNTRALAVRPNARINRHQTNFYRRWWKLAYRREDMLAAIAPLKRYIALSRYAVAGRMSIYAFVEVNIRPMDKVQVFAFDDDYSFGILQSSLHREWFEGRATLGAAISYTGPAFLTFPWPQQPSDAQVKRVVAASKAILDYRDALCAKGISLGQMYDSLRLPGVDPLQKLHDTLDKAVVAAYGFKSGTPLPEQLLDLNAAMARAEAAGSSVRGPGNAGLSGTRVTSYCIKP